MNRKKNIFLVLISFTFLFSLSRYTMAHVPLNSEGGDSLDTATVIQNPTKSWVFYGHIHDGGEGRYYKFDIEQGGRIRITLGIPVYEMDEDFLPGLVLMGPGLTNEGTIPSYVEVAEGAGVMAIQGVKPAEPYFEGFTPSSFLLVVDIDLTAPENGTYYLVIHDTVEHGDYQIAIGYEETFTITEWIMVPINVISIYIWEGQLLPVILSPMAFTIIFGVLLIYKYKKEIIELSRTVFLTGILAGLFYLGSASSLIYQTAFVLTQAPLGPEVVIPMVFALIPIILAIFHLRIVLREKWYEQKGNPLKLVIIGVLALFGWAGLLIGPALAFLTAFIAYWQK